MKNFLMKYKQDIGFISLLSIVFLCIFLLNLKSFVIFLYDLGREFYVPSLILQGKVLYKEVFMMYPPLGYQFNAFLYAIFGQNISVLKMAGFVNAYFIILMVYFIARQFVKPLFSFSVALLIMNFCLFCFNNIISYIYSYSYNLVYATSAFLLFCLLCIIYIKNNMKDEKLACLASFALGLSFANRLEFCLSLIPFLFVFVKNKNFKIAFLNLFLFVLPALVSWGILFIQGLNIADIISFYHFGKNLWYSPQQKIFMHIKIVPVLFETIKQLLYSIFCIFSITKILESSFVKKIIYSIIYIFLTTHVCLAAKDNFFVMPFCFCLISLIVICIYMYVKKHHDRFIYLLITIFSVLISLRFSLIYNTGHYIYFSIITVIFNLVFIYNLKIKKTIKNSICIFLIIISLQMALNKIICRNYKTEKVYSPKGEYYMRYQNAVVYKDLTNWIENNTDKNDKILMLPESPFINFITERPTNNKYFQLLPNHIFAFNENEIIENLAKDMPEYITIQKMSYEIFGQPFLGIDFGLKLIDFILKNYNQVKFIQKDYFTVSIYKKMN